MNPHLWTSIPFPIQRTHIARYIPIASTFKARQILSMCNTYEDFASSLHSLLLIWPDEGKYSTRRTSVISESEYLALIQSFPSMRTLELNCLPYTLFNNLNEGHLASMNALANVRSLNLHNSPASVRLNDFQVVPALLVNMPKLEHLTLYNIALNALEDVVMRQPPTCRLKSLSICITRPRIINIDVLEWILKETIAAKSCTSLKVWLSLKCGDQIQDHSIGPTMLKDKELGFEGIENIVQLLSPSLKKLSLLGPRTGQASAIISKTSSNLRQLEIYDTFGIGSDILHDIPLPSGLQKLAFLPNPSVAYGAPPPPPESSLSLAPGSVGRSHQHHLAPVPAHGPAAAALAVSMGVGSTSISSSSSSRSTAAFGGTGTSSNGTNISTNGSTSAIDTAPSFQDESCTIFTEIPISSHAFIQELGTGGRLENLKEVVVPENARFGRRGRWLNKETIKACRKSGVWITQV